MTSSEQIAGLEMALSQAEAMIERLLRIEVAARDVIAWAEADISARQNSQIQILRRELQRSGQLEK